jgi:hypothetical protein
MYLLCSRQWRGNLSKETASAIAPTPFGGPSVSNIEGCFQGVLTVTMMAHPSKCRILSLTLRILSGDESASSCSPFLKRRSHCKERRTVRKSAVSRFMRSSGQCELGSMPGHRFLLIREAKNTLARRGCAPNEGDTHRKYPHPMGPLS